MKSIILLFIWFSYINCSSFNCSLSLTPKDKCNCGYDEIQIYIGNFNNSILSCVTEEEYDTCCTKNNCTGDITIKNNITCPYNTSAECSFVGIQFPCIVTMFCSQKRTCPPDSSFLNCPCSARTACEELGHTIMNSTDFFEFVNGTHYCENCSTCIERGVRCPTQPLNKNKQLINCFGDITCEHHHNIIDLCISGCSCRIEEEFIPSECNNITFLFQFDCETNFSKVCLTDNVTNICVSNDDTFNGCENGTWTLNECNFTIPSPISPTPPFPPFPPIPPFPPFTPFPPLPPFPPFPPFFIPIPSPPIPIIPSTNCSTPSNISECILCFSQGICNDTSVELFNITTNISICIQISNLDKTCNETNDLGCCDSLMIPLPDENCNHPIPCNPPKDNCIKFLQCNNSIGCGNMSCGIINHLCIRKDQITKWCLSGRCTCNNVIIIPTPILEPIQIDNTPLIVGLIIFSLIILFSICFVFFITNQPIDEEQQILLT